MKLILSIIIVLLWSVTVCAQTIISNSNEQLVKYNMGGASLNGGMAGSKTLINPLAKSITINGNNAHVSSQSIFNSSAFGYNSLATADNQMRFGNNFISSIGGFTGWSTITDKRINSNIKTNVPGLAFINKLQPVTFNYNFDSYTAGITPPDPNNPEFEAWKKQQDEKALNSKQKIIYTGFVAQDVELAAKELNYNFSGIDKPQTDDDLYALRYADFVPPIVKALQELSQMNTTKDSIIASQQQQLNELNNKVNELAAISSSTKQTANDGAVTVSVGETVTPLLGQNVPNPFDNSTVIPFRIPKNCNDASIVISETSTGRIVTAMPVSCSETHAVIEAGKLAAGNYTYTLYVDGKLIDTKSMVLTKN